jgi:hypothetical protein
MSVTATGLAAVAKAAGDGLSILKALRGEISRPEVKRVVIALNTVYFMPSGTLHALKKAKGGRLSSGEAQRALDAFDADEEIVSKALDCLRSENIHTLAINIKQKQALELIRYEKISVRREVREILHSAATERDMKQGVAELVEKIEQLNQEVGSIEELLSSKL